MCWSPGQPMPCCIGHAALVPCCHAGGWVGSTCFPTAGPCLALPPAAFWAGFAVHRCCPLPQCLLLFSACFYNARPPACSCLTPAATKEAFNDIKPPEDRGPNDHRIRTGLSWNPTTDQWVRRGHGRFADTHDFRTARQPVAEPAPGSLQPAEEAAAAAAAAPRSAGAEQGTALPARAASDPPQQQQQQQQAEQRAPALAPAEQPEMSAIDQLLGDLAGSSSEELGVLVPSPPSLKRPAAPPSMREAGGQVAQGSVAPTAAPPALAPGPQPVAPATQRAAEQEPQQRGQLLPCPTQRDEGQQQQQRRPASATQEQVVQAPAAQKRHPQQQRPAPAKQQPQQQVELRPALAKQQPQQQVEQWPASAKQHLAQQQAEQRPTPAKQQQQQRAPLSAAAKQHEVEPAPLRKQAARPAPAAPQTQQPPPKQQQQQQQQRPSSAKAPPEVQQAPAQQQQVPPPAKQQQASAPAAQQAPAKQQQRQHQAAPAPAKQPRPAAQKKQQALAGQPPKKPAGKAAAAPRPFIIPKRSPASPAQPKKRKAAGQPEERSPQSKAARTGGGGRPAAAGRGAVRPPGRGKSLCIDNLPLSLTTDDLRQLLASLGLAKDVEVRTGLCGCGWWEPEHCSGEKGVGCPHASGAVCSLSCAAHGAAGSCRPSLVSFLLPAPRHRAVRQALAAATALLMSCWSSAAAAAAGRHHC